MATQLERWRFSVEEYHRMGEVGILQEDDRVELIDGEIVRMSAVGEPHFLTVNRCNMLLVPLVRDFAVVSVQGPVQLSPYREPEPDVVLIRAIDGVPPRRLPTPEDVLLLIEVSDTTLSYDRNVKLPMYAEAGIPEVLIVNLNGGVIEQFAEPADGAYSLVRQYQRSETIEAVAVPGLALAVDAILG